MKTEKEKFDPVVFAVIKSRIEGIISEMKETILLSSRNPILNVCADFTTSILSPDCKLLTLAHGVPLHILCTDGTVRAIAKCFKDDIHPGDCFGNNDPYYGNTHIGDFTIAAPVFYEGELICWTAAMCHLIDTGAYIPTNMDSLAKDVYEEAMHFPPLRMVKDYKEIPEIVRFIKANFRYPEQWHGDFLAHIGSLWVGERGIHKICEKYGAGMFKQFQDEILDYGDRRMTDEIKKLPKGEWSIEALSEKIEPVCPDGMLLKVKMRIDPDEATITFDLTEMPDQLPWGMNLSEACTKGACIQGSIPSLDPTLPRNDGVIRHFNFILREGAVAGIPRYPAATCNATIGTTEMVTNMVFNLWEQVLPGRGHAGSGMIGASLLGGEGTDFRHDNAVYGHLYLMAMSGGPASQGCDGWGGNWECPSNMGVERQESVELHELKVPDIVWEWGIVTDTAGAGKWRGAPGQYHRIQPRHQTISLFPFGIGHTHAPLGLAGGKPGSLADHYKEKHTTREKVQQLYNVSAFQIKEDEDWVAFTNGGGGYGDSLERDPEAVRDDARSYFISVEAARDEYGVVLNTQPELYEVDYNATEKLRAQLRKERRIK